MTLRFLSKLVEGWLRVRTWSACSLVLLVFCLHGSVKAQTVSVEQFDKSQRQLELEKSVNTLAAGQQATTNLVADEDEDLGPQHVLSLKPRKTHFEAFTDTQFYFTDNATLAESPKNETGVLVNTVQFALAPEPQQAGQGLFMPSAGFRSQWYNYNLVGGHEDLSSLDFNAQTAFAAGRYRFNDKWSLCGTMEYTRLLSLSNGKEAYHEFFPYFGVQRLFWINQQTLVAVGYQGGYHFSHTGQSVSPDINDRFDNSLTVSVNRQLSQKWIAQAYYRCLLSHYRQDMELDGTRNDVLNSIGVSLAYYFNSHCSARAFANYDLKESDDVLVADYRKLDSGIGLTLDFRF